MLSLLYSLLQVAEMVGKTKECVWEIFGKFAPHLDSLQKRTESIAEGPVDKEVVIARYWEKVGNNLLQLAEEINSQRKVWRIRWNFFRMS